MNSWSGPIQMRKAWLNIYVVISSSTKIGSGAVLKSLWNQEVARHKEDWMGFSKFYLQQLQSSARLIPRKKPQIRRGKLPQKVEDGLNSFWTVLLYTLHNIFCLKFSVFYLICTWILCNKLNVHPASGIKQEASNLIY